MDSYAFMYVVTSPESDDLLEVGWAFTDTQFSLISPVESYFVDVSEAYKGEFEDFQDTDVPKYSIPQIVIKFLASYGAHVPQGGRLFLAGHSASVVRETLSAHGWEHFFAPNSFFDSRVLDLTSVSMVLGDVNVPFVGTPNRAYDEVTHAVKTASAFLGSVSSGVAGNEYDIWTALEPIRDKHVSECRCGLDVSELYSTIASTIARIERPQVSVSTLARAIDNLYDSYTPMYDVDGNLVSSNLAEAVARLNRGLGNGSA